MKKHTNEQPSLCVLLKVEKVEVEKGYKKAGQAFESKCVNVIQNPVLIDKR